MRTRREHAVGNVIQGPWSTPAPTGADESERQRLAEEIAAQIVAGHGSVVRWTAELPDVEDWRRAARRAGRLLGVRVRTGVSDDGTKVWVVDESPGHRRRRLIMRGLAAAVDQMPGPPQVCGPVSPGVTEHGIRAVAERCVDGGQRVTALGLFAVGDRLNRRRSARWRLEVGAVHAGLLNM